MVPPRQATGQPKHFLTTADYTSEELLALLALAGRIKREPAAFGQALHGRMLVLLFQKPSMRTRVSFEVGMYQLGGRTVVLSAREGQVGVREEVRDVSRVLSRYVQAIVARTFAHEDLLELARYASVPVVNGLSDSLHPCQALSDMFTMQERLGRLDGVRLGYVGDGNNVLHSLLLAGAQLGVRVRYATPKGHEPDAGVVERARALANGRSAAEAVDTPAEAARGAEVLYTDVWASMGQEQEREQRRRAFRGYALTQTLVSQAAPAAIVMHCLPAHRGEEIEDAVIEGRQSVVFDQAENRLHVQKAVLVHVAGDRERA